MKHLAFGVVIFLLGACGGGDEAPSVEVPIEDVEALATRAYEGPEEADPVVEAEEEVDAGPPRPPARIFARRFVVKVRERPDRESFRIGYLRAGAVLEATTGDPVRTDDPRCRGGWYELTTGGFVCQGRDVTAFWGDRLPEVRGAQPDREEVLPYRYAKNLREGTPMYGDLPTDEQAMEFEGWRPPRPAGAEEAEEDGESGEGEGTTAAGDGEGATAAREGATAAREGATAAREGATAAREGATAAREGATAAREGATGRARGGHRRAARRRDSRGARADRPRRRGRGG
jgi:hypothetical protein